MVKPREKYEKGDECWIYVGNHGGEKSKGTVLEVLDLSEHGYTYLNYLIAIPTGIEDLLEVRNAGTMSPSENEPIGFWKMIPRNWDD